ncbi:MAG: hypothetical protein II336_19510 [Loktanella sp.]|nr:hypothetical protein [Loktanella sp.]
MANVSQSGTRLWVGIAVGVVALVLLVALFSGGSTPDATAPAPGDPMAPAPADPMAPPPADPIGEPAAPADPVLQ